MKIQICFKLPEQEKELMDARYGSHYRKTLETIILNLRKRMDSGDIDRQSYRNIFAEILQTLDNQGVPKHTLDV